MNEKDLARFMSKVNKTETCWFWIAAKSRYGQFWINRKQKTAHRVAYEHFYGWIQENLNVNHICDNPPCVNPEHLWQGTPNEGSKDMVKKGRQAKGENQGLAKLSAEEVIEIRTKYKPYKYTLKMLAKEYGVWPKTIHRIILNKNWKHI